MSTAVAGWDQFTKEKAATWLISIAVAWCSACQGTDGTRTSILA